MTTSVSCGRRYQGDGSLPLFRVDPDVLQSRTITFRVASVSCQIQAILGTLEAEG